MKIVKCNYKPKNKIYCLFSKCDLFNSKCHNNCKKCFYLRFTPLDVTINDLSEVIKKEKWNVK